MKIFGVGTDIVKVSRIKGLIKKDKFTKRLFSEDEIIKCKKLKNRANCFAKRFAAKEAFSKALGTGIIKGLSFNQIVILNNSRGKPFIKLVDKTKKTVEKKIKTKNYKVSLSLSDETNYAVAFVTISK